MLECLGHCHSKLVHGCASQVSGVTCFKFQFLVPTFSFLIQNPQGMGVKAQPRNLPFHQHFRCLCSWNLSYFRPRFQYIHNKEQCRTGKYFRNQCFSLWEQKESINTCCTHIYPYGCILRVCSHSTCRYKVVREKSKTWFLCHQGASEIRCVHVNYVNKCYDDPWLIVQWAEM